MNPRQLTLGCLLALASVAVAVAVPAQETAKKPDDPVKKLVAGTPLERARAATRLVNMRSNAIPFLLRGLDRVELESPEAARILGVLGRLRAHGKAALPRLIKELEENRGAHVVLLDTIDVLAPYDPEQKDKLIQAIGDLWMNRGIRAGKRMHVSTVTIATSRTRLEVNNGNSTKELLEFLETGNTCQRAVAAALLADEPGEKKETIAALRRVLERDTPTRERVRVQFRTANMSASISTSTRDYGPERRAVARALATLSSTKDVPDAAWIHLLEDDDPAMVRRAIQMIGVRRHEPGIKGLTQLLRSKDPTLVWEAITTLGMFGGDAINAVPALRGLLVSPDKGTVVRAKAALRMIESAPKKRDK